VLVSIPARKKFDRELNNLRIVRDTFDVDRKNIKHDIDQLTWKKDYFKRWLFPQIFFAAFVDRASSNIVES
jgi:hypothetical protein